MDRPRYRGPPSPGSPSSSSSPGLSRTTKSSLRTDRAMFDKTDTALLEQALDRLEQMRQLGVIKDELDYDFTSAVQLTPGAPLDFTDRSAVETARRHGFDAEGVRRGDPLRRDTFYTDPYLTCSWCNELNFVDANLLRLSLAASTGFEAHLPREALPACRRCRRADHLVIGSHNFALMIAARRQHEAEREERELANALVIQRYYRAYLKRMYATAAARARKARRLLEDKAGTMINSGARMRLATRIYRTKKYLKNIFSSHAVLVAWALRPLKGRRTLFWYKDRRDIDLLHTNYVELCERQGFIPPRSAVEANIAELSRRVQERKAQLLLCIQRRWRGFMARRIVKFFRSELVRLRQFVLSRVMKIQRAYRGFAGRLQVPRIKASYQRERVMSDYRRRMHQHLRGQQLARTKQQMMSAYELERAEEKTARYTQRIDAPAAFQDRKLRAWAASCYSSDALKEQMEQWVARNGEAIGEEREQARREEVRRHFVSARVKEQGPRGFGRRSEVPLQQVRVVNGFRVGELPESSRSAGMRALFEAERKQLMGNLIERTVKDTSFKNTMPRFVEHNTLRRESDHLAAKAASSAKLAAAAAAAAGKRRSVTSVSLKAPAPRIEPQRRATRQRRFRPRDVTFPEGINDVPMLWVYDDDLWE